MGSQQKEDQGLSGPKSCPQDQGDLDEWDCRSGMGRTSRQALGAEAGGMENLQWEGNNTASGILKHS